MINIRIHKYYFVIICTTLLLMSGVAMGASKSISLEGGDSYLDHVGFVSELGEDVDMVVKLRFDEGSNQLTVSAMSYFTLFGYEQDVRYGSIVRWKKLKPEKMPYVVESDPGSKFRLTKELRHSLRPHKRKHIFQNWLEAKGASYDSGKYSMVNDYLERVYTIGEGVDVVELSLNEIMVSGLPKIKHKGKKRKYKFYASKDLNADYSVEIVRDPCLGADELIELSGADLSTIMLSYNTLSGMQATHTDNSSMDSLTMFDSFKSVMVKQFAAKENTSECPTVIDNIAKYNQYVDSIQLVKGYYAAPQLDPKIFYDVARKLDNYTTRWSLSSDEVERADIVTTINQLIAESQEQIDTQVSIQGELFSAVNLYEQAVNAFYLITGAK